MTHVIHDDDAVPSTSVVEEPILYQTPNVPLNNATFQQLLASIMKEKSSEKPCEENIVLDEDDSSTSDEEDLGRIFDAARASFPTEKDVKHAEVLSVSALELNKTYFVLSGKKSVGTYYNDDGSAHKVDTLIIKCGHIESKESKKHRARLQLYQGAA